ncbi:cob(I)alamin adenolsyltransferase [Veronia nyctiphanis]|uniref:Cob(I)alamin adenolsyltransferase n=1 Tax=Veronia nyctiphanis TaxID=1278244 RepID=A0A4V1LT64_9GAMM|nr:alpha/beta hydrolase [Veronia nyctiphanis]RXJ74108.1 cob(I)alamin adenolsyltransferase [Veronia nyctiphanis]
MKVVLIHGLYMHGVTMMPIKKILERHGHHTLNITYNTLTPDVGVIFGQIDDYLKGESEAAIVAHSMGGIITRAYLDAGSEQSKLVKKVITLGSPHKGAKLAGFFKSIGMGWAMHKSQQYLLPNDDAEWNHDAQLYSLAGNLPIGAANLFVRGESDGTVLVAETRIPGMTGHEVFPLTHFSLLWASEIKKRILVVLDSPPMKAAVNE